MKKLIKKLVLINKRMYTVDVTSTFMHSWYYMKESQCLPRLH